MAQPGSLTEDIFDKVPGQMGPKSARVLIALQETMTAWATTYSYLEIGSFAGRSLQPHVNDPDCAYALSIDLRPELVPDERGEVLGYDHVTTEQMLDNLRKVCPPAAMKKLEALTATSADLGKRKSRRKFDLAFIDAEHTISAAFADFLNILPAMKSDCLIGFDDTLIIFPALEAASAYLTHQGIAHRVTYTRANIGCLQLGRYAERDLLIRPRMLCDQAEARDRYHRFYAAHQGGTMRAA